MIPKPKKKTFKDLEGQRFGRWVVSTFAGSANGAKWLCKCDCGTVRVMRATVLQQGTKSCGCLQRDVAKQTAKTLRKRGGNVVWRKHGMSYTPEYRAWNQIIQRCTNPKLRNYKDYGGRGITVCERWKNSFEAFYEDVGPKPSEQHSIDRIDNNGNYEPGNVRWATDPQQRDNSRHPRKFKYQGDLLSLAEISRRSGIPYKTLRARLLDLGWTVERATTQDPDEYHNKKG